MDVRYDILMIIMMYLLMFFIFREGDSCVVFILLCCNVIGVYWSESGILCRNDNGWGL